MAMRAERLGEDGAELAGELSIVEASLEKVASASGDRGLAREIQAVRAGLCSEQGFRSHERQACEEFMRGACAQAKGAATHLGHTRARRRRGVSKVLCQRFFAEEAHLKASAPAPAPTSTGETLPTLPEPTLPESASSPAGAPASTGEPTLPEESGEESVPESAPESVPEPGDLKFSKKERPLPSQGYKGELVEHNDASTATGDWQQEFGPVAGHRDFRAICRDFPNNQWCRLHMYHDHAPASWSGERSAAAAPTGLCAAFCFGLALFSANLACGVEGGRA